jgi:hypothetical protein
MKRLTTLAAISLAGLASTAHAFKVDTHVWVGQQVINDIEDDGRISLKLRGQNISIAVPSDVVSAILANKGAFLAGNIGPDAAPDVVVGQTVVHPGLPGAWQTHDWMQYLLQASQNHPQGKAFTYGYLGHAAADVFAHTYANQYSGGIFNLSDETLVEQRHIALESYIARYNPPLRDYQGAQYPNSWSRVVVDDALADFIRDELIYDSAARAQYLRQPFAKHLAAYQSYRNGISDLAEDSIWHDIDTAVIQIILEYNGVSVSEEEASAIVDAAQPVLDFLNGDLVDEFQSAANHLYDGIRRYDQVMFGAAHSAMSRMQQLEASWVNKWVEWHVKLAEKVPVPSCPRDPIFGTPLSPSCETARQRAQDTNQIIQAAADFIRNELLNYKTELVQATYDVHAEAIKAADAVREIRNGILDWSQIPGADVSPIQAALRAWRKDLDDAMSAYVKATMQSMVNTMNPNVSAIEPIEQWFSCYHLQIISVSSTISNCQFRDSFVTLYESIDKIIATIEWAHSLGSILGIPSPIELHRLKDEYTRQLQDRLKQEVRNQITDILPPEVRDIIELFDKPVDDATLNAFYTKAETTSSPKHLLMIADMADRVKAEMYLSGGAFDPQRYAVVHNAVVLAKLALLNRTGLDALAAAGGVPLDGAGNALFASTNNVVASAFASIDGNHQWMRNQPTVPNSANVGYGEGATQYASPAGFVPWEDRGARDRIFRALFIGPVSPGVDSPNTIGKSRIVSRTYPYQPCRAHPFPNDIKDRTCVGVMLAPIMQMLLE